MLITRLLVILAASFVFSNAVFAAPGDLDSTFGVLGRVSTNLSNQNSTVNDLALASDGKIIVAGTQETSGDKFSIGTVARYTAAGVLDTTFSGTLAGDGISNITVDNAVQVILNAVVIQSDGKILVAGFYQTDSDGGLLVARLNPNGTRDASFGSSSNGIVQISVLTGGGFGFDVVLQPDGKIAIAGAAINIFSQTADFAVYRLNQNGTRDGSFGSNGVVTAPLSSGNDVAFSLTIQPDGKLVAVGARSFDEVAGDIAVVRLNSNGSFDNSFGAVGTVITPLGAFTDIASDVQLQTDGKIVTAGVNCLDANCQTSNIAVLRYNANGTVDAGFDGDGVVLTQIPTATQSGATSLAIQSNGKIVIAGQTLRPVTNVDAFVARYNQNGALDSTFGTNGIVVSDVNNSEQVATSVLVQPDGKIVAAGASQTDERADFTVWRYLGDASGAIAKTNFDFDNDAKADISVFRPVNGTWYIERSQTGFSSQQFGQATDQLAPADYDGDRKTDVAVFRPENGTWYILNSQDNSLRAVQFGAPGDVPRPADYDADGKADLAVYRQGIWFILQSSNGALRTEQFGATTDKPLIGDFDADGKSDLAVFRPETGFWYLQRSTAGFLGVQFGAAEDRPVTADYDGDGKTDVAVFRPSNGIWYLQRSQLGFSSTQFGASTDVPAPADYDGDGKADLAVFRSGTWYLQRSTEGFTFVQFGAGDDLPVPAAFVP